MTTISVIVPCFNEELKISKLLDAIYNQSYPRNEIEVLVADGLSTDQTRAVIDDFQLHHSDLAIKVIDNPQRAIPSGLNRAIEAAHGKYLIRLDAHSIPNRDYIQKCVDDLDKGLGDNVGGIWKILPGAPTLIAKAIALATSHPLGAGDALYRIGGASQEVDTVPFGAFSREIIDRVGKFDETLLTNEDYEFNARIRQSGGKIWLDPSIQSVYFARSTIKELARQYWRYGYWKAQMLRRYPNTLRWRQILPPLFVFGLLILGIISIGSFLARWSSAIIVLLYMTSIILAGIQMSLKQKDISLVIGMPLAIATIHLTWGTALLWGLVAKPHRVGTQQ